jgi:hypothetical protein
MTFKEWFESQDDVGNVLGLEGYASQKAWDYQQTKIDELQERIDKAVKELSTATFAHYQASYHVFRALNALKGEMK